MTSQQAKTTFPFLALIHTFIALPTLCRFCFDSLAERGEKPTGESRTFRVAANSVYKNKTTPGGKISAIYKVRCLLRLEVCEGTDYVVLLSRQRAT